MAGEEVGHEQGERKGRTKKRKTAVAERMSTRAGTVTTIPLDPGGEDEINAIREIRYPASSSVEASGYGFRVM